MATETDFLYLVLLILLTFVVHLILASAESRRQRRSH
jgi:hypothetical protein